MLNKWIETLDRDFELFHCLHLQSMIYISILQMYIALFNLKEIYVFP